MARRIGKPQRIVGRVAIPVQRLRITRIGHDGVGGQETANVRIIPSCAIEVKCRAAVPTLAGETIGGELAARVVARRSVRVVPPGGFALTQLRQPRTSAVGGDGGRGQMVGEQVVGLAAGTRGHAYAAGVVILANGCAVVPLVDVSDVDRGHAAHRGLDPVAVGATVMALILKVAVQLGFWEANAEHINVGLALDGTIPRRNCLDLLWGGATSQFYHRRVN